jgi:hypothetical protein
MGLAADAEAVARRDLDRLVAAGGEVLSWPSTARPERDAVAGRVHAPADAPRWPDGAFGELAGLLDRLAVAAPAGRAGRLPSAHRHLDRGAEEVERAGRRLDGTAPGCAWTSGTTSSGAATRSRRSAVTGRSSPTSMPRTSTRRSSHACATARSPASGRRSESASSPSSATARSTSPASWPRSTRSASRLDHGRAGLDVARSGRGRRGRRAGAPLRASVRSGPMRVAVDRHRLDGRPPRPAPRRDAGVDEVLVVDAVAARAEAVARDTGARATGARRRARCADAVVVATPAHLHASTVEAAPSRGVCRAVREAADRRARLLARPGRQRRGGRRARRGGLPSAPRPRLRGGARADRRRQRRPDPSPPTDGLRPGGGAPDAGEWTPGGPAPLFLHSSIHDFDFVRWISGQEVVEVSADGSTG